MTRSGHLTSAALTFGLASLAALFAWQLIGHEIIRLSLPSEGYDVGRMLLLHSSLPRLATALMAGAGLALSGVILQQALRNPLASPTTMGVSSGAHLALVLASLFMPELLGLGRDLVALIGSALAALLVFALISRRDYSPVSLILAGLIVSLYCGALASLLVLLNDRYLASLFIWGAGSLSQQDWSVASGLLPKLLPLAILGLMLIRPLSILQLGESGSRALGLKPGQMRAIAVAISVAIAALITSAVGVIGFIGLAAPALARLAGARTVAAQIIWSPLIGAALLWFTDGLIQMAAGSLANFVPTGAVTALFGSPLLLLLLPRLKTGNASRPSAKILRRWEGPIRLPLIVMLTLLALLSLMAVWLGRNGAGVWEFLSASRLDLLLDYRLPRVGTALSAGVMLAVAGVILQRLTGNEMASPEVLGINAGAMIGLAAAIFILPTAGYFQLMLFAALGTLAVMAGLFLLNRKSGFQPERLILAGIALGALLDALVGGLAATGDLRALQLLRWMAGSTYGANNETALIGSFVMLALILPVIICMRWLDLLPLGPVVSKSLGLNTGRVRMLLLLMAALLTAAATLIVGPLSFVGLMAPHMARAIGFNKALPQILAAALAGATIMVLADWIGRVANFPYEMPAGILSALVGAPFLMMLLHKGRDQMVIR